jgi:hypothetical protein
MVIGHCGGGLPQHAFQIAHGLHCGEAGLTQIHLVAIFEGTQQFHAIERTNSNQLRDQTSPTLSGFPFHASDQSANELDPSARQASPQSRLNYLQDCGFEAFVWRCA